MCARSRSSGQKERNEARSVLQARIGHIRLPWCAAASESPILSVVAEARVRGGMIEVRDLVYEYPNKRALDGVSLTVAPQTITALVGPNGAGKTTLLRCLAALEAPYSGSVIIDGLDTREAPARKSMRGSAICRTSTASMTS